MGAVHQKRRDFFRTIVAASHVRRSTSGLPLREMCRCGLIRRLAARVVQGLDVESAELGNQAQPELVDATPGPGSGLPAFGSQKSRRGCRSRPSTGAG